MCAVRASLGHTPQAHTRNYALSLLSVWRLSNSTLDVRYGSLADIRARNQGCPLHT
jgi:hypothetical protein